MGSIAQNDNNLIARLRKCSVNIESIPVFNSKVKNHFDSETKSLCVCVCLCPSCLHCSLVSYYQTLIKVKPDEYRHLSSSDIGDGFLNQGNTLLISVPQILLIKK